MTHDSQGVSPPDYFDAIRDKARARWEQLEADPELAAPWHQLFKQVQSPRHVVSELLQNADDAGATEAQVRIVNGEFVFSHDGNDFIDDEFASLCRFGYSNKRSLHTIGFRGIGFKSTFSLGDEVRLRTPTLSIAFLRGRFSEPVWIGNQPTENTEVSVIIKDEFRQREIEKNLGEWLASPASLLFFDSIRCLRVGEHEVRWDSVGEGPVPGSTWMTSSTEPDSKYLVVRSDEEPFPPEAVEEIRQERMISSDDESSFPPCRVEIVLGMEGRLFVILPTGVKTELPFACNAPFIQDPARVKIKDPDTSPANRWLLKRAGELAASAMCQWLHRHDLSATERCHAYALLPDVNRDDNSIEGTSGTIAEENFEEAIADREVLLTENELVVRRVECVSLPSRLLSIWTPEQVSTLFDEKARPLLSRHISTDDWRKLSNWNLFDEIEKSRVLDILGQKHLPRPGSWRQLLSLWSYVSDAVSKKHYDGRSRKGVRIIPVQSRDVLYSADEVVRLGEKRLLHSEDDWDFLSQYLLVINQNWPRYLAEQRRIADDEKNDSLHNAWAAAQLVLVSLDLYESTDVGRIIETVAAKAFAIEDYPIEDCIRIAQIAARLGATVTDQFQFVMQNDLRSTSGETIAVDVDGQLDRFVDNQWYEQHVLHDDYNQNFVSCSQLEWERWILSGKSKLLTFVPLAGSIENVWGRQQLEAELRKRNHSEELFFRYSTDEFMIDDLDFSTKHWMHWKRAAKDDSTFWSQLLSRLFQRPAEYTNRAKEATVSEVAKNGRRRTVASKVPSAWLVKLRDLPCLVDTRGQCRKPAELLRRTPATEALLDVEPFVRIDDDNEHTRPLLELLGVGATPTGPKRLLDRLRTFVGVKEPPVFEVEKWYHRLDQLLLKCSTAESQTIQHSFATESLILTHDGHWCSKAEVFLNASEEDVPDAPLVHASVRHLTLWQKIGVAERPSADLAIEWLTDLPSGKKLSADELRRVRALLPKFPLRIWEECGHWLSLDGQWAETSTLKYSLTMQSLVSWSHLFQPVKQTTADMQRLDAETCRQSPFSDLPTLASRIEDQFSESLFGLAQPVPKAWMLALGQGIARIELDEQDQQDTVRQLGHRIATTLWQVATGLESIPYIDGTPAGTSRRIHVLWKDDRLYVDDRPVAQLFKSITQEIARVFDRSDIGDAIRACVERSPEFIQEYLEENFRLSPPDAIPPQPAVDDSNDETASDEVADDETEDTEDPKAEASNSSDVVDADQDADIEDQHADGDADVVDDPADDDDVDDDDQQVDADDELDDEDNDDETPKPPPPRKTPKPHLIELMAAAAGFSKDGTDRFFHADGGWIQKSSGNAFPWERYSGGGELVQSYWVKDCCIEREPLQLDAAIWNLCERHSDGYSIVLRDPNDQAIVYSGAELLRLRSQDRLTLHPANYRLVYHHSDASGVEEGKQDG
ncbi:MAG: ATPase [Candidatus Paceibacterota bacterium]